jgi:hypothetical protein
MSTALAHRIVTAHEEPELDFLIRRLARRLRTAMPLICMTQFPEPRISRRCRVNEPTLLIVSEAIFREWEGDEIEYQLAKTMAKIATKRRFRLLPSRA